VRWRTRGEEEVGAAQPKVAGGNVAKKRGRETFSPGRGLGGERKFHFPFSEREFLPREISPMKSSPLFLFEFPTSSDERDVLRAGVAGRGHGG